MAEGDRVIRFHAQPGVETARQLAAFIALKEGRVRLAVAGGSVLPVLGDVRRLLGPERWERVRLTWVDERCVPFSHPDSNRGTAYREGHLDPAHPPRLELPLYLDGETPEAACNRVRGAFQRDYQGHLDAVLLGLGEDGHIASLFPGRVYRESLVIAVDDSPKPPPSRISFALPVLVQAERSWMLALGSAKLDVLRRLQQGDPALPASALRRLNVLTDQRTYLAEEGT